MKGINNMNKEKLIDDISIYFIYGYHRYKLTISNLESYENFSINLYKNYINNIYLSQQTRIFSTWIDSDGGEVLGNCEIYMQGYDDIISYCYDIFNKLIVNKK